MDKQNPSRYLDVLTYLALFAAMGVILYHLLLIWIVGPVLIYENNKMLLASEIVLIVGLVLLGVVRLANIYLPYIKAIFKKEAK